MPPRRWGRRALAWVALGVAVLALAEALSFGAIAVLSARLDEPIRTRRAVLAEQSARLAGLLDTNVKRREVLDPVLGWRYRAGFRSATDALNAQGLRSLREYGATAGPGVRRVAAFGDSFVYGNEVADADVWTARLEELFPTIEALNYGVGGFGSDQAYLRYQREGTALAPDVVALGFVPDDLGRVVNVYRRFRSSQEWPFTKPRYLLADADRLVLLPNPFPTPTHYRGLLEAPARLTLLGQHDYWYEPAVYENPLHDLSATVRLGVAVWVRMKRRLFDDERLLAGGVFRTGSPAFQVQVLVMDAFVRDVRTQGARPLLLLFPDRESLVRRRAGLPTVYAPLADALAGRQLPVLDLVAAFPVRGETVDIDDWFMPGGHYSPEGNRLVALHVGTALSVHD